MYRRPVLVRPLGPGRAFILRPGLALDSEWNEQAHPRAKNGQFGEGGSGSAAPLPVPSKWHAKHGELIKASVVSGMAAGDKPEAIADKIKKISASYAHPLTTSHANAMLKHLEQVHGLKAGELGKAAGKKKPEGPAKESDAPSEAEMDKMAEAGAAEVLPIPHHLEGENYETAKAALMAAAGSQSPEWKQEYLQGMLDDATPDTEDYIASLIDHVVATMPVQAAAAPPAKVTGPMPHPDSGPQKQVYEVANGAGSNAEKAAQIKKLADGMYQGGYAKTFADQWIDALGGVKPQAQPGAKPEAKQEKHPQSLLTPYWQTHKLKITAHTTAPPDLARTKDMKAVHAGAMTTSSVQTEAAKKAVPSLSDSFWSSASAAGRDAVESYTGSGYDGINTSLRDTDHTNESDIAKANEIDELFEREETKTTVDSVVHRGEDVPAEDIEKWVKALAAGKSVRYAKQGFISASMASRAKFAHKNTQMEIVVRKGTRMLGVDTVTSCPGENEVVMRHGQSFEIYDIVQTPEKTFIKMVSTK